MQRMKLITVLAMALIPLLAWPLALSSKTTPIVASYGVPLCVLALIAIAFVSAWLVVGFLEELHRQ